MSTPVVAPPPEDGKTRSGQQYITVVNCKAVEIKACMDRAKAPGGSPVFVSGDVLYFYTIEAKRRDVGVVGELELAAFTACKKHIDQKELVHLEETRYQNWHKNRASSESGEFSLVTCKEIDLAVMDRIIEHIRHSTIKFARSTNVRDLALCVFFDEPVQKSQMYPVIGMPKYYLPDDLDGAPVTAGKAHVVLHNRKPLATRSQWHDATGGRIVSYVDICTAANGEKLHGLRWGFESLPQLQ